MKLDVFTVTVIELALTEPKNSLDGKITSVVGLDRWTPAEMAMGAAPPPPLPLLAEVICPSWLTVKFVFV